MLKKSGSMKKQDASKIPGSEFNCNVIVVFATCGDQKWQWVQKGLSKLIRDGMAKPSPEFCRFCYHFCLWMFLRPEELNTISWTFLRMWLDCFGPAKKMQIAEAVSCCKTILQKWFCIWHTWPLFVRVLTSAQRFSSTGQKFSVILFIYSHGFQTKRDIILAKKT